MKKNTFLSVLLFSIVIITTSLYAFSKLNFGHINSKPNKSLFIAPPPTVDFSFNNSNECSGTQVNFTPTVTGDGPFSYLWHFGDDGSTSTSNNPSHSFTALGCGTSNINVTLTVTDANDESTTVTKAVPVSEKPNLNFYDIDAEAYFTPSFDNCGNNTSDPTYTINVGNRSTGKIGRAHV